MEDKMILYGVLAIGILVFAFVAYSAMFPVYTQENYQKALAAELSDICATPAGYTDEGWQTHMSHHPDRYAECFG